MKIAVKHLIVYTLIVYAIAFAAGYYWRTPSAPNDLTALEFLSKSDDPYMASMALNIMIADEVGILDELDAVSETFLMERLKNVDAGEGSIEFGTDPPLDIGDQEVGA